MRSIAIPRIGVGYGGLSWKKVRLIVERVFADWSGQLVVYEEFIPEGGTPEAKPNTVPEYRGSNLKGSGASPPTEPAASALPLTKESRPHHG